MNVNLVLLKKSGAYKAFPLAGTVTVIGRRDDCDLRIPLPMVSRRHCQLRLNKNSVELRDLDSRGGTFVNDKRVDEGIAVKAGDYIRIGPLTFVCRIDGKPEKIAPPKKGDPKRDVSRLGTQAAPPAPKAKPKPKPQKPAANAARDGSGSNLDDDLSDLDVSDSFLNLDESDSDLEDLKNV
jgi:pSer/pThr/pTyr-binding forkhead associated (FHA) protein